MNKHFFKFLFILILFIPLPVLAMDITASWDEVIEDIDNSPEEIEGYFFYYGNQSRGSTTKESAPDIYDERVNAGNSTSYNLTGLDENLTYCFAVTAYDRWGNESEYSAEFTLNAEGGNAQTTVSGGCGNIGNDKNTSPMIVFLIMVLIMTSFMIKNYRNLYNIL